MAKPGLAEKLRSDFSGCGLPTELPFAENELNEAIWKDKKVEGDAIHFVLIKRIGKVVVEDIKRNEL